MKTKYLVLGICAVLATAGYWGGRTWWRVHHQLVTLDVRNAPLADVLRSIERQTWKSLRMENKLNAHITLHVKNKPLAQVLDRIAEQAGARWSTLYAVYNSKQALQSLDAALSADGKFENAGWTRIAPSLNEPPPLHDGPPMIVQQGDGKVSMSPPPAGLPEGLDGGAESGPPGAVKHSVRMFRRGENGPVVIQANANGQVEMWSAEELLLQTSLLAQAGEDHKEVPSAEAARETARKVNGKWTTYLAFRKSIMGAGFASRAMDKPGHDLSGPNPNERFGRLTPEQRVQRAREHAGSYTITKTLP